MDKIGTKRIETERLILRRFTVEDADAMYRNWASDPLVTKYLTWPPHATVEDTRALLADWVTKYDDGGYFNWAIERKGVGLIGSIGVVSLSEEIGAAELGYCIGVPWWGEGLMTEAVKALLDFLFDEVGVNRVTAKHDVENPRSGRVMTKAGMHLEGTLRQAGKNNRGIIDVVVYSMIRSDRN